ncbi:MAG: response regulator [Anaerolineales bacterium]|jgi:two-component system cell cycle response regulator DivK
MHFLQGALKNPASKSALWQELSVPPGYTILVVEDNGYIFVQIARILGSLGVYCEWKTSGYELVEFANSLPRLDLILMDIHLPYEDEFCILKKLRVSEQLKDVPIIAMTFEADLDQMERAQVFGLDGFLSNPPDPDTFPGKIYNFLRGDPVWEQNKPMQI